MPAFRLSFTDEDRRNAHLALDQILTSGRLVLGPYTEEFETRFAELIGARHVVAVNTGTTALEIIFRHLAVDGREVLVPANTNFATARAVLAAGGTPVLHDGGLHFELDNIVARIGPCTAAVVVVHVGGYISPEISRLRTLLDDAGIPLVEDAAHAHGSRTGSGIAGRLGYGAAFSFFPTKVLTTFEGGAVVTDSGVLAAEARSYRDQGKDASGNLHVLSGSSWRMTEIGAALGAIQLFRFRDAIARRMCIIRRYERELGSVLEFPTLEADDVVSGHKAVALTAGPELRERLRSSLSAQGVSLGRGVYEFPLHTHPVFAEFAQEGGYPRAEEFASRHVALPIWTSMTDVDVDHVIEAVSATLGEEMVGG